MPRKKKNLNVEDQVSILFEHALQQGIPTELRAIADATGLTANNVHKIRRGQTPNPGVQTLKALGRYFGVGLAYFDCETREACWEYIRGSVREETLSNVALRASEVSDEGLQAIENMVEYVRQLERNLKK